MSMKDGIKTWIGIAFDAKDEMATFLIDGGVDPKEALHASTILSMARVDTILEKQYGKRSASFITSDLSSRNDDEQPLN